MRKKTVYWGHIHTYETRNSNTVFSPPGKHALFCSSKARRFHSPTRYCDEYRAIDHGNYRREHCLCGGGTLYGKRYAYVAFSAENHKKMNALPQKYAALLQAEKAGISVPKTLLVNEKTAKTEIEGFLRKCRGQKYFLVRSAVCHEDGGARSFAGHFWSSGKTNREKVYAQTKKALRENTKRVKKMCRDADLSRLKEKIFVMIQPFVQAKYGGVLFTQWKHYPNYFLGEITQGGAQKAVEGKENSFFLLHKHKKKHVLPLNKKHEFLEGKLQEVVKKIEKNFPFPADIEWVVNRKNEVVILQIRPVTAPIEALFPAPKKRKFPRGKWTKNALSESLGVLSPLSFALVKKLFFGARKKLQKVGCEAKTRDFLLRLPNGEVLVDEEKEKNFWKNASFFSSFFRGLYRQKMREEAWKFISQWRNTQEKNFSFSRLQKIFSWWMVSNVYVKMPANKKNYSYELLAQTPFHSLQIDEMTSLTPKKNWKSANTFLRTLFFIELEKLKKEIAKKPEMVFFERVQPSKIQELFRDHKKWNAEKKVLQKCEEEQVHNSLYDFSSSFMHESAQQMQKVAGKEKIIAPVYVAKNPYAHTKNLPRGVILIAPFFRNEWIWDLPSLAGVVLEQGGVLSHSAIVAREKNIPYFIHVQNATTRFAQQKTLILDCKKNTIQEKKT